MQVKRKTIGRTLNTIQLTTHSAVSQGHIQRFTLKSGKSAAFHLEFISADELEIKTFVRFLVNGRDQLALTPESLADITRTIKFQQFFPAIGQRVDGRVEILDGSRRRAAALISQVGLMVLVTDNEISNDDARQLAVDIQTAKEHNLREVGLRLQKMKEKGMSQKEIALIEKLSASKVSRAIQAASVSQSIISLFPVQEELNYNDYKMLLSIESVIRTKNLMWDEIFKHVNKSIDEQPELALLPADELKRVILATLKKATNNLSNKKNGNVVKFSKLWSFNDKNIYARKRQTTRGFCYEFNRVPHVLQDQLDEAVKSVLTNFYSKISEEITTGYEKRKWQNG